MLCVTVCVCVGHIMSSNQLAPELAQRCLSREWAGGNVELVANSPENFSNFAGNMKPLKLQQTKCEMENGNILTAPKTHTSSEPFGHVLLLRKLSSRECENKLWKSWSCQLVCMWTPLERSTSSTENICCIFFYCNNLYATTRTAAATPNGANIFNCQLSSDSSEKNDHLPSRRSVVLCLSLTLSCCHNTFRPCAGPHLINAASSCAKSRSAVESSVKFLFPLLL